VAPVLKAAMSSEVYPPLPSSYALSHLYTLVELVRDKKYAVTVLTRDVSSTSAIALTELGNVTLIPGSYETEKGLREALKGQHGVYVNFNSFAMTESMEYFWTFRLSVVLLQR
jgi:hypothetical protein